MKDFHKKGIVNCVGRFYRAPNRECHTLRRTTLIFFIGLSRFAPPEQRLGRQILGKFIQQTSEPNPDRRKMIFIRLVAILATSPSCPPTRRGFLLLVST